MVAINKILLPEAAGEGCSGGSGTCADGRVHRRNAENRVPATRNHRRTQPLGAITKSLSITVGDPCGRSGK